MGTMIGCSDKLRPSNTGGATRPLRLELLTRRAVSQSVLHGEGSSLHKCNDPWAELEAQGPAMTTILHRNVATYCRSLFAAWVR